MDLIEFARRGLAAQKAVDELTFQNYRHNRLRSPGVKPEEWRKIYGERVEEMERRFQEESKGGFRYENLK